MISMILLNIYIKISIYFTTQNQLMRQTDHQQSIYWSKLFLRVSVLVMAILHIHNSLVRMARYLSNTAFMSTRLFLDTFDVCYID